LGCLFKIMVNGPGQCSAINWRAWCDTLVASLATQLVRGIRTINPLLGMRRLMAFKARAFSGVILATMPGKVSCSIMPIWLAINCSTTGIMVYTITGNRQWWQYPHQLLFSTPPTRVYPNGVLFNPMNQGPQGMG
jgi:hypothetical protein